MIFIKDIITIINHDIHKTLFVFRDTALRYLYRFRGYLNITRSISQKQIKDDARPMFFHECVNSRLHLVKCFTLMSSYRLHVNGPYFFPLKRYLN